MEDKFGTLRSAVKAFMAQPRVSIDVELTNFRNAASVLTVDELLRAYDAAVRELANLTQYGPLGPLSAEEIRLLSISRALSEEGRRMVLTAAEAAADVYDNATEAKSAEVIELRPKK